MSEQEKDPEREARFSVILGKLAAGCRQALDDVTIEVYIEALCYRLPPERWEDFVRDANKRGRYPYFPTLAELIDDVKEFEASTIIAGALPADTRTPEQRAADGRETARRFREVVSAKPMPAMPRPAQRAVATDQPKESTGFINDTDERLEFLRKQAEELRAEAENEGRK